MLVVGTNGKGSTAVLVDSVLRAHGLATGLYTSPHLVSATERISISGQQISTRRLEELTLELDCFPELTFFETLTAAALLAFAEADVEVAILEAGMGGRWDATRAAPAVVAGLTNVGTDHAGWLGREREQIAKDKGSALADAMLGVLGPGVDDHILHHLDAPSAVPATDLVRLEVSPGGEMDAIWDDRREAIDLPFEGAHQVENLHLALAMVRGAARLGIAPDLDPRVLASALESARWPARLSRHRIMNREILIDGAHNLEAATALAQYLEQQPIRHNLLFSALDDKPIEAMANALRPHVDSVAVCPLADERSATPIRLLEAFPESTLAATPFEALAMLGDPVVAAGSLRLAGVLLAGSRQSEFR